MPSLTQKLIKKKQKDEFNRLVRENLEKWDAKHDDEIDALILWELHEQFGFGAKRLRRFYDGFTQAYEDLRKRYECTDEDAIWVCQQKLRGIGVDIKEWKEKQNRI